MTINPLTPPPTAPSRSDPPATFITRADAFINWWSGTFTPEFNALLPEIVLAGSAINYGATSTTSLAIGTGSKSLTVQADKAFQVGQFVQIANTATPANYMFGQVTAYNASTGALTVLVSSVGGSGTFTAWTIGLAATGGAYAQLAGATFTGKLTTPASSSGGAGFNIPHGSAPSSPINGDMWTTTSGLTVRINGVSQKLVMLGGDIFTGWIAVSCAAAPSKMLVIPEAGWEGAYRFSRNGSLPRWEMAMDAISESGANAGSSWRLRRYNDAGSLIGDVIVSDRDTGVVNIVNSLLVNFDPVVTHAATQTLTNKTLTAPTINSAALNPTGAAPLYPARAWVNFNGTGTISITGAGNVSSITDIGVGDYGVNFATAMPDALYGISGFVRNSGTGTTALHGLTANSDSAKTTTGIEVLARFASTSSVALFDSPEINVIVTR